MKKSLQETSKWPTKIQAYFSLLNPKEHLKIKKVRSNISNVSLHHLRKISISRYFLSMIMIKKRNRRQEFLRDLLSKKFQLAISIIKEMKNLFCQKECRHLFQQKHLFLLLKKWLRRNLAAKSWAISKPQIGKLVSQGFLL